MGVVPGWECVVPLVGSLADVWGMCSTWRVPFFSVPLQPDGLLARGGRIMQPSFHAPEGYAKDACSGGISSHILWRRERSLGLVGTG